ncbi:uncharacterized protein BROUX77_005547 [Berkeleyomyces rouxiae]|uniref:uncharacterized protein n=1 Tax=Berkeleyomyces rouxiae TaxID=2035830 RepID=UPI003B7B5B35
MKAVHETILEAAATGKADIVCIQEPYTIKLKAGYRTLTQPGFTLVVPFNVRNLEAMPLRPRVLTYVRQGLPFSVLFEFGDAESDIQTLRILASEPFSLLNVYNERQLTVQPVPETQPRPYTIERTNLLSRNIDTSTLLLGDFNLHHHWWNSQREHPHEPRADSFANWLMSQNATLIVDDDYVERNGGTYVNSSTTSVIDLAFSLRSRPGLFTNWRYLQETGSDHRAISFDYVSTTTPKTLTRNPAFNTKTADWSLFRKEWLAGQADLELQLSLAEISADGDAMARLLSEALQSACQRCMSVKRHSARAKPWWTPELQSQRQAASRAERRYRRGRLSLVEFHSIRNKYTHAVEDAKSTHWTTFLSDADNEKVYTAWKYTKPATASYFPPIQGPDGLANTPEEKEKAFLTLLGATSSAGVDPRPDIADTHDPHHDPHHDTPHDTPPNDTDRSIYPWPDLTDHEIKEAIMSANAKKAPGPDGMNAKIIQIAFEAHPAPFLSVYKALSRLGIHPTLWKQATGIVLAKDGKADYSVVKSYRIISLLNCLGKVLEKVFATRLGYLANCHDSSLLDDTQLGGRKQRSAMDAALVYVSHLQKVKEMKLVPSTLFLDVKGAFDHVSKPCLMRSLRELGLPLVFRKWVASFLQDRTVGLHIEGQPFPMTPVNIGIPQGSPISPLLFLLYARHIVARVAGDTPQLQLSYIDDFSVTVASKSPRRSAALLEELVTELRAKARDYGIEFEESKTELIHYTDAAKWASQTVRVGDVTVRPQKMVKWLGFHFDNRLSFKQHVQARTQKAEIAFRGLLRLASNTRGLSIAALRQLYISCVGTVADYGSILWYDPSKPQLSLQRVYQKLQSQAAARILGTFRGSPTRAVEVEAGLPPPSIRFAKARMAYAARTLRLQRNHPVRVASQPDKDELAPDDSDLPLLGHNMSVKTRLGCIMRELKPLVAGMWRRERRRQEWDSPWQPPLTDRISIVVDPGPKEDAAVRHAQFLSRLPNDAVTVYTDGSKEGSRCSLAACVVDTKTGEIKTKVSHRLQDVEVADCESAAIVEALTLLAKTEKITKQARPCYVFVDSQAAIARLRKHGHFAWQARRVLGTFTSPVTVMWCPGHMGIVGNEIADAVARQALESDDERKFSSLGSVFARVRRFTMDKWETLWAFERDTAAGPSHGSHYLRTIGGDPVLRAKAPKVSGPRWLTSAYFQMKVGKGNLLPYLLLIKKTDSDRCRRCQEHESESVEHVLLHCAAFSAERQEMAMALSPKSLDLPTLFNTNNGTEVLLKFVRKTGFCTKAWVEVIYSSDSRKEHRNLVCQIIRALGDAGLQLDWDKSEFESPSIKYLGFIVEPGSGIRADPDKVKAIQEWEAPTSVRGVRSFLGFANFYRCFVPEYSTVAAPLTLLTKKDQPFKWEDEQLRSFEALKKALVSAPLLATFDPDLPTIVEADASGWALGGSLRQQGADSLWRPVAYFSRKLSPAEVNYPIHDKEMLAIHSCLRAWRSYLAGIPFEVHTDHQNLLYFQKQRTLSERQRRWAHELSEFDFRLIHRPGVTQVTSDALSRRDQDLPQDLTDERLQSRVHQVLRPDGPDFVIAAAVWAKEPDKDPEGTLTLDHAALDAPFADPELQTLWHSALTRNERYWQARQAVQEQARSFPNEWGLPWQISECTLDSATRLLWRDRLWIPYYEPLRTRIIQQVHDSTLTGHPGGSATRDLVSRSYAWPGLSDDVRRFVGNCDTCGKSKIWRDQKRGLLKPLPVPDRAWQELAMDFIVGLPESEGCTTILGITDRLSKSKILIPMQSYTAPDVARAFITHVFAHHGLPRAITSDRGPQFTGLFWTEVCRQLSITRRLSTAFHPETDGAQERSNQEIETYLRAFTAFLQDDWAALLPQAQVALNNRTATATGLSPFFFTHGYNIDPLDLTTDHEPGSTVSPATAGHNWLAKHRDATAFAQASMAVALETQERHANRGRQAAEAFKVGDRVYLRLRNVRTIRPSKTLDWLALPYRVIQIVGTHAVKLDTPTGIHPVFHVSLVRRARDDPLPSQVLANPEPPAIAPEEASGDLVAGEYLVDEILRHKVVDKRHKVLVQWTGWAEPTWEPLSHVKDTAALERYEQTHECPWKLPKIGVTGRNRTYDFSVANRKALPGAIPLHHSDEEAIVTIYGSSPDLVELQPDAIAPLAAPVAANTSPIAQATRILHCAAFSAERQEMAMALSPKSLDLPTLFNTNNGTEVLLKFVRKTGFCTKAWVEGVGRRESSGVRRVEEVEE